MRRMIGALAAACAMTTAVWGQTLADRVPSDSFFYVGFKGGDALAGEYAKSHLKAVIDGTDLWVLMSEPFHDQLANAMVRGNESLAEAWPNIVATVKDVWPHPVAFCVYPSGGVEKGFALICDAGADGTAILEKLRLIDAEHLKCEQVGNFVVIGWNLDPVKAMLAAKAAKSLATEPGFVSAMKQVDAAGALVGYASVDGIYKAANVPDGPAQRAKVGLDNVHEGAFSGSFVGADWRKRAFLAVTGPRKGIASFLDSTPLSDGALAIVPKTAQHATVAQVDLAGALKAFREMYVALEPQGQAEFDKGMGMVNSALGMDVEKQLLPTLGREWVIYEDSSIASTQLLGTVIANRLQDPAKAEAALGQLQQKLLTYARAGAEMKQMRIPLVVKQAAGAKLYTINLPLISPSWTIRDGVLYVGAYPQVVLSAADFAKSGKPTLRQTPMVATWIERSGKLPASLNYVDMNQAVANGYGTALMLSRYVGLLDLLTGVETPTMVLPTLPVLQANSSPVLTTSWSDAAGWHMEAQEPFAGADALGAVMSSNLLTMQAPATAISILLPSLSRAREKANQVKCASNLRQIGQGIMLFSADHKGQYPDSLGQLVTAESMSPVVFVCPSTSDSVPENLKANGGAKAMEWVNANTTYIYLGKGLKQGAGPDTIVAYEKLEDHGEGSNVLFADGHVEFVIQSRLKTLIAGWKAKPQAR